MGARPEGSLDPGAGQQLFQHLFDHTTARFSLGLRHLLLIFIIILKMLQDNILVSAPLSPSGASKEQSHSIKSSTLPDRQELFAS